MSTSRTINATLHAAAKFIYLMGRDSELPARFGQPVWNRLIGGLLATNIPARLAIFGGLLTATAAAEVIIRKRERPAAHSAAPAVQGLLHATSGG